MLAGSTVVVNRGGPAADSGWCCRGIDLPEGGNILSAVAVRIRFHDVGGELRRYEVGAGEALRRVISSGQFVLGPELEAFEQEFARFLGVAHAVGTNSGTDALVLTLEALGIGRGDEVVTTPFSFFATAEAVMRTGAVPVFADIEPETLCLAPDAVEPAVTPRTRAVVLVHIFGHCTDIDRIQAVCRRHNLLLIEDACQAVGATWQGRRLGTFGIASCFSFYPTKNLACLGDGGAIATGDGRLAQRLRELRVHGRGSSGYVRPGYNSRLDELQAAFLRHCLPELEAANSRRQALAVRYDVELPRQLRRVRGAAGCSSSYHQYAVLTPDRDRLREHLAERGVETGVYYATPLHREPALAGRVKQSLPQAEVACREVLSLPIRPSLTDEEQTYIISSVAEFFGNG
uniref:DegT/DnrJ/EryC1/StrS family aminotransferase n=1 Tax=candidate division WOR-3 bacterium TaxID=2052148 RepID=A0A7C4CBX5_UNCW3